MAKRLYAVIGDYEFLAEQINDRRIERSIALEDLDELADLPEHFASKACGPSQSKRWGLADTQSGKPGSLFRVLEKLGLRLALIEDDRLTSSKNGHRLRQTNQVRTMRYTRQPSMRTMRRAKREMGKRGAEIRWRDATQQQRSEHGRHMANSRWSRLSAPAETGER